MKRILYIMTILVLLISVNSFALTAVVQDSDSQPIKGATVTFSNHDTVIYTDTIGRLEYDKSTPVNPNHIKGNLIELLYNSNNFTLKVPEKKTVSLALFNTSGRKVMEHKSMVNAGIHQIKLPPLATGLYVLKASVGAESFTGKIISNGKLSLVRQEGNVLRDARVARAIIDTVHFKFPGYADVVKPIFGYDLDLGTIEMNFDVYTDDWYGFKVNSIDTTLPCFVNILFRAYDKNGYGIPMIDTSIFTMYEDSSLITSESQLIIEKATSFSDTTKTIVLIDNSSSVSTSLPKIKEAAKRLVNNIAPNQKISIYAFSENSVKVTDFTSDTEVLKAGIDAIPVGYSSTNLYGALIDVANLISNHASFQQSYVVSGNVVLFTDGKDTQGSQTLSNVLKAVDSLDVYAIGFGEELALGVDALEQIAKKNVFITTDLSELESYFIKVQQMITLNSKCYYWAYYRSPKRGDFEHTLSLEVTGNSNSGSDSIITGTFNSALFQAGWAPTAESLSVTANATKDSLIGNYIFKDKDGEVEGNSNFYWEIDGSNSNVLTQSFPLSLLSGRTRIVFGVQPISLFGSPQAGSWVVCTVTVTLPDCGYTYGYKMEDYFNDVIPTSEGYLMVGKVRDTNAITTHDLWAVMVDEAGDTLWNKLYGLNTRDDGASSVLSISDGFIVAGHTETYGAGAKDFWVLKLDTNGDTLWTKTFGGYFNEIAENIIETDSGYIAIGTRATTAKSDDFYLVEMDKSGNVGWQKTYGGTSGEIANGIAKAPSGYMVAGYSGTYGPGYYDIWLMRIDDKGDSLWTRTYGGGNGEKATGILATGNDYLITGYTASFGAGSSDFWALKVNLNGDTLWTKTYGGTGAEAIASVSPASGGFILVGSTSSYGAGGSDIWAVKINETGDTLWTETYGGTEDDRAESIVAVSDGYVIAGYTKSFGARYQDAWILKIDEDGNALWDGPVIK